MTRPLVRFYLPIEMGAFARACREIARAYPDAKLGDPGEPGPGEPAQAVIVITEPL